MPNRPIIKVIQQRDFAVAPEGIQFAKRRSG